MPKKSFALRIDEKTMKAVEKWATDEFRSVNGQLEWIITKMLRESKRMKTTPKNPPETVIPITEKKEKPKPKQL